MVSFYFSSIRLLDFRNRNNRLMKFWNQERTCRLNNSNQLKKEVGFLHMGGIEIPMEGLFYGNAIYACLSKPWPSNLDGTKPKPKHHILFH